MLERGCQRIGWRLLVGVAAGLALTGPALGASDVTLSEQRLIEPDARQVPVAGDNVALTRGADGMLLVYTQQPTIANGPPLREGPTPPPARVAVGQLLTLEGEPVGTPFDIAQDATTEHATFDGETYLVSWRDSASATFYQRISSAGQLLGLPVKVASNGTVHFAGGSGGRTLLVTCSPCRARVLVGDTFINGDELPFYAPVRLAYSDGAWLVWPQYSAMSLQIDEVGQLVEGTSVTLAEVTKPDWQTVQIAPIPTGFAVAWETEGGGSNSEIRAATLDFDGTFSSSVRVAEIINEPDLALRLRAIQRTPAGVVVFADRHRDNQCQTPYCDPGPEPQLYELDENLTPVGFQALPPIAGPIFSVPGYFIVKGPILQPFKLGDSLALSRPALTMSQPARQHPPRGASAPEGWLVAWTENAPSYVDPSGLGVRASLLASDGTTSNGPDWLIEPSEVSELMALQAGPGGWMMAVTERGYESDPVRGKVLFLPHGDPFQPVDTGLEWWRKVEIASSTSGWLVASASGSLVISRKIGDNDFEEGIVIARGLDSEVHANVIHASFDGEQYVVAWVEGYRVFRVRIPTEGEIDALLPEIVFSYPPDFPAPDYVYSLDQAVRQGSYWILVNGEKGSHLAGGNLLTSMPGLSDGSIVALGDQLLGTRSSLAQDGDYEVIGARPGEEPSVAASGEDLVKIHLSDPSDRRVLMTGLVRTGTWGERITRVAASVVELEEGLGGGGGGGEAGEAGQPSGGRAGDGGHDGMASAGAPDASTTAGTGGTPAAAGSGAGGDDDGTSEDDDENDDAGCDCRMAASSASGARSLWFLVLAAALGRRRRSVSNAAATAARS